MNPPPKLRVILASIIAQNGGMPAVIGVAKTFALLAAFGFAAVMPFAATYELYRVHAVSQWPLVPARIVSATLEPSSFRRGSSSYRYRFVDMQSGKEMETGDMRPGDLPFTFVIWSTADAEAARLQARVGQIVQVRQSPDGREFYPEAGDMRFMTAVLALYALFWGWLFWRRDAAIRNLG